MFLLDLAIMSLTRYESARDLDECVIERFVVEENPVVVIVAVESVLNLTNGTCYLPNIGIAGQCDESCVHALTRSSSRQPMG